MATQPRHDLVRRYVDAWNDPDPVHRRSALACMYTDEGCIVTQSGIAAGIDAVVDHVGQVYAQFIAPGRYQFASGGAVSHHDCVLFRWEMREVSSGDLADAGMNFFLLCPEGCIVGDYQFTLGVESSIGSDASTAS